MFKVAMGPFGNEEGSFQAMQGRKGTASPVGKEKLRPDDKLPLYSPFGLQWWPADRPLMQLGSAVGGDLSNLASPIQYSSSITRGPSPLSYGGDDQEQISAISRSVFLARHFSGMGHQHIRDPPYGRIEPSFGPIFSADQSQYLGQFPPAGWSSNQDQYYGFQSFMPDLTKTTGFFQPPPPMDPNMAADATVETAPQPSAPSSGDCPPPSFSAGAVPIPITTVRSRQNAQAPGQRINRAFQACDGCRRNKSRCDEQQPCSRCRENGSDCIYRQMPLRKQDEQVVIIEAMLARMQAEIADNFAAMEGRQMDMEDKAEKRYARLMEMVREQATMKGTQDEKPKRSGRAFPQGNELGAKRPIDPTTTPCTRNMMKRRAMELDWVRVD